MALSRIKASMIDNLLATLVSYTRAALGAVKRTMQSKSDDVWHVKDFGVVGDGVADDTAAAQAAITAAFTANRRITLDFSGCTVGLTAGLVIPAGGGVSFTGGRLLALATFPSQSTLMYASSQTGGLVHYDLSFDRLTFDGGQRGNCLLLDNYIRVNVTRCRFLHFVGFGLRLDKTIDSHEAVVSGCWAFQYLYGEAGYTAPSGATVGFQINSFDNIFDSCISYYTGRGMVVNAQYNQVAKCHLGGVSTGLQVTGNGAFSSFNQCYIDSAAVVLEDPWHVELMGCKFLANTASAQFAFVVLRPSTAGRAIKGLKITGCSFHNIGSATVGSVYTDTTSGSFSAASVDSCYIGENSFQNALYSYTRIRMSLYQAGAVNWVFNLTGYFPFGSPQKITHAFLDLSNVKPTTNIAQVTDTAVAFTNSVAGNGTIYVDIDVNTGTS